MSDVFLVKGDDPVLKGKVVAELVDSILSPDDKLMALEDFTIPGKGESEEDEISGSQARVAVLSSALTGAQSPPFMTDKRVIVIRDIGLLAATEVDSIVRYISDPMPTTILILVAGGGRTAAGLVKAGKGVIKEIGPPSENTDEVLEASLGEQNVSLTPAAKKLIVERIGQDAGRIPAIVEILAPMGGPGVKLGPSDVEPYLGDQGSVPIYQLTNAIEAGNVPSALETLHRLLFATSPSQPKPMHPLQILATLQNTYRKYLRLDDPNIRSESQAVSALGGKIKPYPAKKALSASRKLGRSGLSRAFDLLARADIDMKGATGQPPEAVVEVLVARLAKLS